MEFGELFLVENPQAGLEEKVLWAADSYQKKYGQAPTLCLLHPSLLEGRNEHLGGLRLEAKNAVLPNYLWIGVLAGAEAMPVAR